jgi:hypothetical protein
MALSPKFSNTAVNAEANALAVLLNNGYIRIYTGTQPANADTAITSQVLLAELRFNATAFGAAVAGVLTANTITTDTAADNTGTATWFRALQSDGTTVVLDGSAGESAVNLVLESADLVAGESVGILSFVLTVSKG